MHFSLTLFLGVVLWKRLGYVAYASLKVCKVAQPIQSVQVGESNTRKLFILKSVAELLLGKRDAIVFVEFEPLSNCC